MNRRTGLITAAALACGVLAPVVFLESDHLEAKTVWAVLGPLVGWSFIGTGLYTERRRPESHVGTLMIYFGFAWFLAVVGVFDAPAPYTVGFVAGGVWGGVFLQLVLTFPSGRLANATDRRLVIAGYLTFTVAAIPVLLFASPHELGCDSCPENLLLVDRNADLAHAALALQFVLYAGLFVVVLVRLVRRWLRTPVLERLQLTPVYVCGMVTFLLVTAGAAGAGNAALWPAFVATALLPAAFLVGLLRSHVARLDEELRASRMRIVAAGDTERRRLERNLHDGAQARLVGLAMLLGQARRSAPEAVPGLLDDALVELRASLSELRDLARGIHPAVLTEMGLDAALYALASRAPVPVTLEGGGDGRLPEHVEAAAYYVVAEALTNVAKYARASEATVTVRRDDGRLTVEVGDDGVGGADAAKGSGLSGLADRIAALDGTLWVDSPPGGGTRVHVEIRC
jgi:signal transduction histidine kinase